MSADQDFVHLHVHTEFSLLDGLSKIDKLTARAAELGMKNLAITDHGAMFGVIHFWRACQKAGIKPIIGMEGYLAKSSMHIHDQSERQPFHLLLLAKDQAGYKNLLKIASAAQLEGFYSKPRIDRDFLAAHAEGLICTSGCLAAEIPRMITDGREDEARKTIGWYQDAFGADSFFLELQDHDIPEIKVLNKWLVENQGYANVPLLATNDVHYVLNEDFNAHDTLLCIQTGALKSEVKRMRMTDPSYHLRTQKEMWEIFGEVPSALTNTLLVAEMCNVNLDSKGYHLPVFPVPNGYASDTYLRALAERGLNWRYGNNVSEATVNRLNYELGVIHQMGFDTYFLIVWDLCQYARHADIWWNVRGSGAGSVVAYCLGITNIDPISNNLIFERFLNPGRVSMPDIDMDFPDDRRMDMIDYAMRKYGSDKVAAIITFGTMKARAAIKDVGRVLDYPLPQVNELTKLVPQIPSKPVTLADCLGDNPEKAVPELRKLYDEDPSIRTLLDTALTVEGVARNAGTHAAGVIIGDKPLVDYLPLHRPIGDSKVAQITQFPMEICESIGLLKVDFLGLSTLTIMRKACELIEKYHGIRFNMSNIPYRPDPNDVEITDRVTKLFDLIGQGETTGVFQLESEGMTRMLKEMKPQTFENIIAAISLYRPGPMELIPSYIKRMHGKEEVVYHHPLLEPILRETYGICIAGDTLVIEARTGQRYRVDELEGKLQNFYIQSVDENYQPAIGRVTHWIDNGVKPVYCLTLRNGSTIKATCDHKFLSEQGWKELQELQLGGHIAVPLQLVEPTIPTKTDREKLRILAYLIADGSLASGTSVDFINKEPALLDEYVRCLDAFDDTEPTYTEQIHGVTRIGVRHKSGAGNVATSLLKWMQEFGFKYGLEIRHHQRGISSQEKSVPELVFSLDNDDLAYFLASLWDCGGYVGGTLCHYKTFSKRLANDVQTLLLRFGIASTIRMNSHELSHGERVVYQVTLYDAQKFVELVRPYMLTDKRNVNCESQSHHNTISHAVFIEDMKSAPAISAHGAIDLYGVDKQHFYPALERITRISSHDVHDMTVAIPLPKTLLLTDIGWDEIASIESAGEEHVYDLTIEDHHNFIANNMVVHNCVYQEQIQQIAAQLFGYSLGDADLMRRAVSKKKAKDLAIHKQTFMEKGPERGITPEIAEKIFAEIEFFAAYGFNKSHAADYAVLTCQTAYLKAHFPEEYYTALLSVQRDVIEDVRLFINDCRHFNIAILPPNVNYSDVDFTIERTGKGNQRGIRYGLGAVKNAGEKAVQAIIDARIESGPFKDISDFGRRVDLRQVGKRAMESLIRIGAFDQLAGRDEMLASLDRIVKFSTDHHRAIDNGQMSLFGGMDSGTGDDFVLTPVPADKQSSQREKLRWEKDLIGLYVSEHPLNAVENQLRHLANMHRSETLRRNAEIVNGRNVTVAGLIVGIRTITTKKGDPMAVITLEDVEGVLDCVLFPRTWNEFQALIKDDKLVIMRGKADSSRGDIQIIVDHVTQDFDVATAVGEMDDDDPWWSETDYKSTTSVAPEWNTEVTNGNTNGNGMSHSELEPIEENTEEVIHASISIEDELPVPAYELSSVTEQASSVKSVPDTIQQAHSVVANAMASFEFEDEVEQLIDDDAPSCLITITLVRSDDPDKDRRRFNRVQNKLIQVPGHDQFRFRVVDEIRTVIVDFPNHSTRYKGEVEAFLRGEFGTDAIQVEPLPR